jgi:hypothetical protein
MGGFFKKVAGAFVYLDEEDAKAKKNPDTVHLDQVARDTDELIAQLGGRHAEPSPARTVTPVADAAPSGSSSLMTADDVFKSAGLADGPNSAQRVLKIITGLAMFSREQQVVMVRAMDGADDTWSEDQVLQDARRRQAALRNHLQSIDSEKNQKLQAVTARTAKSQSDGKRRLDDIDQQIAELQKLREEAVATATSELNALELEKKQTEEAAEKARRGITTVINALSELITFFTGPEGKPAAKS